MRTGYGKNITLVIALALLASGCSNTGSSGKDDPSADNGKPKSSEPVKLSMYMRHAIPEEYVQQYIIKPVQNKFPNITLELVYRGVKGNEPQELITAGTFPDLVWVSTPWIGDFKKMDLLYDLNDLIKKNQYDVSKHDPTAIDGINQWGSKNELYALPLYMNFSILLYNKDLFDKFGVGYPKDGMTWDETIELARKMSRTVDGINYKGLDVYGPFDTLSQLSLPFVDPKTNKARLEDEVFKRGFEFLQKVYSIDGNGLPDSKSRGRTGFLKGTTAMYPDWNSLDVLDDAAKKGQVINWDMVSMPAFKEAPGKGRQIDSHNLAISATSKHKEEAFQVISYLTSKEVQMEISKSGRAAGIMDPEVKQSFGKGLDILKGKNAEAPFKTKPAPLPPISIYWVIANSEMTKAFVEVVEQGKDINSALRDANERANKAIETELSAMK